jgi:PEP-CTERM motif
MRNSTGHFVLAVALLGLTSAAARAELLVLSYSGSFDSATTLGGVALGAPTPFTFQATFDSTTDIRPPDGQGIFDTVVTFDITGFGTFTSDPAGDVSVFLTDPTSTGSYGVGLTTAANTSGFLALGFAAAPPFDADVPVPSSLTGFTGASSSLPFTVPLTGGAGDLVIFGFASFGETATITAVVPEPSTLALAAIGGGGLVGLIRRRSRA